MCLLLMVFYCFLFSPSTANRMLKIEKIYTMRVTCFSVLSVISRSLPTPPWEFYASHYHLVLLPVFLFFPSPLLPLTWFFFQLKNHVTKTSPPTSQPPLLFAFLMKPPGSIDRPISLSPAAPRLFSRLSCKRVNWRPTHFCLFFFLFYFPPPAPCSPSLLFFFCSIPSIWRLHVDMYI